MTREEASNILWWVSKRHYPGDQMDITAEDIEAFDMAIAALREYDAMAQERKEHRFVMPIMAQHERELLGEKQPDPYTGLMPCGCGRAMRVECYPGNHGLADAYQVFCYGCNVGTIPMRSAERAQVAWNRAMGWRVEG